jgi:hypothetical protein
MLFKRLLLSFVVVLVMFTSVNAQAPTTKVNLAPKPLVNFFIGGALEFGGTNIAMVSFVDGSKQYIKAGQGGTINAGINFKPSLDSKWFFRGLVGFKYLTTKATNVNIMLTRIPLRLSTNYNFSKNIWGGLGIASHQGINFNAGGLGNNVSFSGNVAPTFEFGYREFSLIYTPMTYKDPSNATYDASAIGLAFYVELHKKKRSN